ncbi:hypothetical protein M422DRAFT_241067 [Sphaerobolus stellatus SS14]|nr:hypothetical protein M422DRAFT_241067 [Sphaerobolus stellatus SS14]
MADCSNALVVIAADCGMQGGSSTFNEGDDTTFTYTLQPIDGLCPSHPVGS